VRRLRVSLKAAYADVPNQELITCNARVSGCCLIGSVEPKRWGKRLESIGKSKFRIRCEELVLTTNGPHWLGRTMPDPSVWFEVVAVWGLDVRGRVISSILGLEARRGQFRAEPQFSRTSLQPVVPPISFASPYCRGADHVRSLAVWNWPNGEVWGAVFSLVPEWQRQPRRSGR
jgi:hypothetical protein